MITHVAIRYKHKADGFWRLSICSLPAPLRHHHVIEVINYDTGGAWEENEQGFQDQFGNFYNRIEALEHALENNQVKHPDDIRAGQLFSEDIW